MTAAVTGSRNGLTGLGVATRLGTTRTSRPLVTDVRCPGKGNRDLLRIWGVERRRQEFTEFYTASRDDCLRIVLVSVGDRKLAEDLVAEAFTRAWMSWRK